jgi:hypothetical protein
MGFKIKTLRETNLREDFTEQVQVSVYSFKWALQKTLKKHLKEKCDNDILSRLGFEKYFLGFKTVFQGVCLDVRNVNSEVDNILGIRYISWGPEANQEETYFGFVGR